MSSDFEESNGIHRFREGEDLGGKRFARGSSVFTSVSVIYSEKREIKKRENDRSAALEEHRGAAAVAVAGDLRVPEKAFRSLGGI
ncbi:hypothetical protein MRB53_028299 [Persea americana]|uniref:Uncharacterized protein n=1 Tax=Persea americana TaxID=3435 RepID=A0ACC2KF56_PERAE|nr:hypothetical protein MRB53_028299 [Persea americana]